MIATLIHCLTSPAVKELRRYNNERKRDPFVNPIL